MAGIGFELRKMFNGKGIFNGIRACLFSSLISVGPSLMCMFILTFLQQLLAYSGMSAGKRELFMAITVYCFVFSLIIDSIFITVLSRYVSDKIYKNETDCIIGSFKGALTCCMLLGGTAGGIFLFISSLDDSIKLASYILFMELIIIWILMIYISALKDYRRLLKGFAAGIFVCMATSVALELFKAMDLLYILLSIDTGFFIILAFFLYSILNTFKDTKNGYYDFLEYFRKYPALCLFGVFYNLGIYSHNFIFWCSSYRINTAGVFVSAPVYDVPAFWAFLSVIPTLVVFTVFTETSFYEKSRLFYHAINYCGTLKEIKSLKKNMLNVLSHSMKNILKLQLIFTLIFLIMGAYLLPGLGITGLSLRIFNILVIGNYAFAIMLVATYVLLHFDDRRGALAVSAVFISANISFTVLTVFAGADYYGSGFTVSAFIAMTVALIRLYRYSKDIEYFTYRAQQALAPKEGSGTHRP